MLCYGKVYRIDQKLNQKDFYKFVFSDLDLLQKKNFLSIKN